MIDMQQVSMALNMATRRSLLVIDELGKGTESCGWFISGKRLFRTCHAEKIDRRRRVGSWSTESSA